MRVLVTGGAGFIGSHVVDALLESGHVVRVVDDFSTGHTANLRRARELGLEPDHVVHADVAGQCARDIVHQFRPDGIVLLAAQMSVKVSMRAPLADAQTNLLGLVSMLEAAREAGLPKIVFASSGGTIYGEPDPTDLPVTEDHPRRPTSFYGLTKSVAVDYLRLYRDHFGVPSTALALGNVYGPRQDPGGEAGVVTIFAGRLRRGLPCIINGDGSTTRDYVHVSDVSRAVLRALNRGDGLINIGTGIETSVSRIYELMSAVIPATVDVVYGPGLPGEVRRVALSVRNASTTLGWEPTVQLEDGLLAVATDSGGP